MDEPRVVELPSYHVAKLRYQGPPPPHPDFFEHWRRFHSRVDLLQLKSQVEDVAAVGYAPPGPAGSRLLLYDAHPRAAGLQAGTAVRTRARRYTRRALRTLRRPDHGAAAPPTGR